jgi:hypothetical protein
VGRDPPSLDPGLDLPLDLVVQVALRALGDVGLEADPPGRFCFGAGEIAAASSIPLAVTYRVRYGLGMKTTKCEAGCGTRTMAAGGICRTCQSKRFRARKDVDTGAVIVDEMAGGWWIWSKTGEVLVMDKSSKDAAVRAYIDGERAEEMAL